MVQAGAAVRPTQRGSGGACRCALAAGAGCNNGGATSERRSAADIGRASGRSNEPAAERKELGFEGLESTH
jgi:hypothetical protein